MGSVHVANVAHKIPGASPSAVCNIRLDVAQELAEAHGINPVVRNYHELLEDPSIEAVVVITSTLTRADIELRDPPKEASGGRGIHGPVI